MTLLNGLTDRDNERVALMTLAFAQAALPTPEWPDLAGMQRSDYQEDSFLLELPIGNGFVAPLEVGLHHQCRETMQEEAALLADCVRSHLKSSRVIISGLRRVSGVAEALAARARAWGAPIEFESVGIEAQASAWGFPMGRTEVVLTYPGEQMRPMADTFTIGRLSRFRDEVAELAATAAFRARVAAALERHCAVAFLDPIAHAAIEFFGLAPLKVLQRLLDRPHAGNGMNDRDFHPAWLRSTVHCRFNVRDGQWWVDQLLLRRRLPDAVLAAAVGRRLCEVAEHPILNQAVVEEAFARNASVVFKIRPLAPLLLMADGTVVKMAPPDAKAVLAILADAPARPGESG